jgi:hypothetical protein
MVIQSLSSVSVKMQSLDRIASRPELGRVFICFGDAIRANDLRRLMMKISMRLSAHLAKVIRRSLQKFSLIINLSMKINLKKDYLCTSQPV